MSQTRFHGFDWLRCAAIVAVICIHVTDVVFWKNDYFEPMTLEGGIYYAISACLRFCVPVFFVMSGFLLENRALRGNVEPATRLRRYLFPLVVASIVYTLSAIVIARAMHKPLSLLSLLERALAGQAGVHTWFLVALALYVALHNRLRVFASGPIFWVVVCFYMVLFAVTNGRLASSSEMTDVLATISHLVMALPYYISGIWLSRNVDTVRRIPRRFVFASVVAGIVATCLYGVLLRQPGFYNPANALLSASLVLWAITATTHPPPIVSRIAALSLGIYLWHLLFLIGLRAVEGRFYREAVSPLVTVAVVVVEIAAGLGGGLLVASLLARSPRLRMLAQ